MTIPAQPTSFRPLDWTRYGWPQQPTSPGSKASPACTPSPTSRLPDLVRRTRRRPAQDHPPLHRALRPVDAGTTPPRRQHRLAPGVGRRRVLPDLRHRRRPRALPRRVRPPPTRPAQSPDARAEPSAVRSDARRRARLDQPGRLRPGLPTRPAAAYESPKPPASTSPTSAKNTATGSCAWSAKVTRSCSCRCRPRSPARSIVLSANATHGPILRNRAGARLRRRPAITRLRRLQAVAGVQIARMHPHMLRHTFVTTMLDAGVDLETPRSQPATPTPRTTMRDDRARTNLDRHPNYILAAYMSSGT